MKQTLALLCLALACAAAYAAGPVDINALHKKLQAQDPTLAGLSGSKASVMYADDKYKYAEDKYKYEDKYEKEDKYYGKDKYEKEDKYYGKDKEYYGKEDKYYGKEDKYYGKDEKEYKDYYQYGYGDKKVTLKLWEKARSPIRTQTENPDTFQFSSTVTCVNPKEVKELHSQDGVIDIPVPENLKVIPVGICEWTVNKVKEQVIGEAATIKGSTNVVCTFTEEAERQCPKDILCEGMSVSAQGLLYHFDKAPAAYGYEKDKLEGIADLDVILSLINGVNGGKKKSEYDNGVIQFLYGAEAEAGKKGTEEANHAGEYTFVFKH